MPQSLHCPQCNANVTVGPQHSGQRVACPRCGKQFVAPGSLAPSTRAGDDEDDWLTLDDPKPPAPLTSPSRSSASGPSPSGPIDGGATSDDVHTLSDDDLLDDDLPDDDAPLTLQPVSPGGPSGSGKPPTSNAGFSEGDLAALGSLGMLDDDFLQSTDTVPSPTLGTNLPGINEASSNFPSFDTSQIDGSASGSGDGSSDDDLFGDLPPVQVPSTAGNNAGSAAVAMDPNQEFRLKCPICGSLMYAKARQAGKQIKCGDCHSLVKVPQPPKVKPVQSVPSPDEGYSFALQAPATENKPTDPYQKNANELLAQAAAERDKETKPKQSLDMDVPSVGRWLAGVFGIFKDSGVILHWIILSSLLAGPAAFAYAQESTPLYLGVMIWSVLFGVLVISCGFAIMQAVANQLESVTDWPTMDPPAWFEQLMVVVMATAMAAAPPFVVCKLFGAPPMISLGFTMFCVYIAFPFLILSMLDMQSIFTPFSPEVARSATQCSEAWGGLYFSSAMLFGGVFFFALFAATSTGGLVATIFLGVAAIFVYFSMIGRLAYAIGQAVNGPTDSSYDRDEKLPPQNGQPANSGAKTGTSTDATPKQR
ncbi:zinc-ribbon domain-containing protein [Stieleria varia]|uniref:Uncharacterized protein n=1 Tax=Stieleria varia TaxID=2528005 RepID=A0A5C6A1P6_9BACT|nr:zinc-ribbon domain-containing protein [Stieleria varia]TWT93315.1 hypothetical protein Pla52n_59750 [Stieleria varia]